MPLPPPPPARSDDELQYNLPLYGTRGEFSLTPNVSVPYCVTLMDLKRLTRELKTHEEVSPSLDTVYSLVELFQRKIDEKRVRRDIIDGYLKLPNKLKFFNSLVVALLPKAPSGEILPEFEDYANNDPKVPYEAGQDFDAWFGEPGTHKVVFGGVQFISADSANLSRLRWDANRVDAVAVDGQHRLRALKLWMQDRNNDLSEIEKPTRVPVIFLLLHSNAGFRRLSGGGPSGIKVIAREIFTDLNKNAREVDLATEIILDDRSIEACAVRSLVTDSTCTDDDRLLPLSLLRWREANNRFDQSYFLNSLVNLHLLVGDLLDLDPPSNPMDPSAAKDFIKKATGLLGTGEPRAIRYDGVSLEEFYEQEFLDQSDRENAVAPFTGMPAQFLLSAVDGFRSRFSSWLLRLLRDFKPYKDVITYAREKNLIKGEFGQYLSQPDGHQTHLDGVLQDRHGDRWRQVVLGQHISAIEAIKGLRTGQGDQWAFKTIFQKAFVRLGKMLFLETPEDERSKFGTVDDFLVFFDRLHEQGILTVKASLPEDGYGLWTFIAVNYGSGKIKVASTSERRIKAVLTLWYFAWRYSLHIGKRITLQSDGDGEVSANEIAILFSRKSTQSEWPVNDCYGDLVRLFEDNAHVIAMKPTKEDVKDSRRSEIARSRLRAVMYEGLKPWVEAASGIAECTTDGDPVLPPSEQGIL